MLLPELSGQRRGSARAHGRPGAQGGWRARRRPGAPRSWDPRYLCRHLGGHPGHGSVKTLEVQFAKLVSVPMKVQIHRQSKVPKVPMRACHPHGGVHARPISKFEKWSHYTKFIMLIRNFTTPCPGKFTSKSWTKATRKTTVSPRAHC